MSRSLYQKIIQENQTPPKRRRLPLMCAAAAVAVVLVTVPVLGRAPAEGADPPVAAAATLVSVPTVTPTPIPTPTPTLALDFSQPVPERTPVEMDYFSDALFIGDSRTQGLRLYSGIKGATFYDYIGLGVFGVNKPGVVTVNGKSCSIMEALEQGPQFGKIYIAFGLNELGYYNTEQYLTAFRSFVAQIKTYQPNAIIYLQNLAPVEEARCRSYGQAACINNDRVAVFNQLFAQLAQECRVPLVDIHGALADENGTLADGSTSDGIHFQRPQYETWLAYLMSHTVDPVAYQAGQTN